MRLARLHYEPPAKGEPKLVTAPSLHSKDLHVFLELPDHLGSESLTIDYETGELVEARTYQAYGATESDYRPDRWKGFREDYGFTGKEEDVEVGLQYFGKRYLSPYLGRWISADPLAVHAPGSADLNLYAYVHGAVLKSIDPIGLDAASDQLADPHYVDRYVDAGYDEARDQVVLRYEDGATTRIDLSKIDTKRYKATDGQLTSEAKAQVENAVMNDDGIYAPASLNNLTAPSLATYASKIEKWKQTNAETEGYVRALGEFAPVLLQYAGAGSVRTPFAAAETTAAQRVSVRAARLHFAELAWDPAVKKFRWAEANAALLVERTTGAQLQRSPGKGDWVDQAGVVYDHMQTAKGKTGDVLAQVGKHLNKEGVDVVVIELSGASPARREAVEALTSSLPPEQQSRILLLK